MQTKASKLLEKELEKARKAFRENVLVEESVSSKLAELSGRDIIGKDEKGQPVKTKHPEDMRMRFFGGMVEIRFKEYEKEKKVVVGIAKGVRLLKHIVERYEEEMKKRDLVLKKAEELNARLATEGLEMDNEGIEKVKEGIGFILENTALARALCKKLANEKLEKVQDYLEMMRYAPSRFKKQSLIAAACSKIVAFRNRFGEWRERESAGISSYNKLREYGLRQVRDALLKDVLLSFEGKSKEERYKLLSLWERDLRHIRMLEDARQRIDERFEKPEELIKVLENICKSLRFKGIEEYAKRRVESAIYYLGEQNIKKALLRVEEACEIMRSAKVWVMVEEIEKTEDAYMDETLELIKKGLKILMENRDVYRSSAEFKKAAEKLGN